MNKIIFEFGYFRMDYMSLILSVLVILVAVFITIILKRKKEKDKSKKINIFSILLVWFIALYVLLYVFVPTLKEIVLFETNAIQVKLLSLGILIIILLTDFLIYRALRAWFDRVDLMHEKSSFALINIVLWVLSLHFIFKFFLKEYQNIVKLVLFKIQNVEITIYNFIFILLAVVTTVLFIIFLKISFNRLVKKNKIDKPTAFTLLTISKYFIWVFALIIILQTIGLNLSVLLAGSAALLVGVGLGIQQVFNDFASGLILLFEREIKVGDYVEADTVSGTILSIGFRTTIVLTRDNVKIIIPNSKLVSDKVINWTKGEPHARVGLDVGVAYGSDTKKVKEVLIKCANNHSWIMKKPAPEVFFTEFADSSLNFKLYFYTEKIFVREKTKSDLRFTIYDEFNKEKIEIPFPQVDVHLPNKQDK